MPIDLPETLTRKLGPLPTWGWGVAIIGGYAVFRLFRKGSSDGSGIYSLGPGGAGGIEPNTGGGGSGAPTSPDQGNQTPNTPNNPQTPSGPGAPGGGGGIVIPSDPWWQSDWWRNLFPVSSPTPTTGTPTGSSPSFNSGAPLASSSLFSGIASDIGSLIGSWDAQLPPLDNNAAPERTLPGTIYAGTVGASVLSPEQAAQIQYNTPEFASFVNQGQDNGQTEFTLNTLVNYSTSGGYAGSQADLDAAIITAANSEVARIQATNPDLSRDQIIRNMAPTTRSAIERIEGSQSTTGFAQSPGAPRSYAVPVP